MKKVLDLIALCIKNILTIRFSRVALFGMLVAGCSLTMPIKDNSNVHDKLITQSIAAITPQNFPPELTSDDWKYAKIALGIALDPIGTGEKALWVNPKSGIRGDFIALGKPYLKNDFICRKFNATLNYQGQAEKIIGAACRFGNGQWAAYDLSTL